MQRMISIRWKAALFLMGVVFLLAGLDAWLLPRRAAEAERDALVHRGRAAASMVAHTVRSAMEFDQPDAAQEDLAASLADDLVAWAAVYNEAGNRVASVGPLRAEAPRFDDQTSENLSNADRVVGVAPIRKSDGGIIGHVFVSLRTSVIEDRRRRTRAEALWQAAIVAILGFALAMFFSQRLVGSIKQVSEAAERIARGDVSQELNIDQSNDELGTLATAFKNMNSRLRQLQETSSRVAAGDLTAQTTGDGELYVAFRSMVQNLRALAGRIGASSEAVASAATGMFSAVREQETSATQQTSALEEIRRTLESLAASAQTVTSDAAKVREIADQNLASSQRMAEQTQLVSTHSDRIGEILQLIQDIAARSDLLALNAALEGTKAGEVGRGFSLVAAEMRRLSEHVMDSVRDIRKLIADMRAVAQASVLATEEGIKLSRETAASAAKISEAIAVQREGTSQVKNAADDIVQSVNDTVSSNAQTTASAEALLQLSHELRQTVHAFKLPSVEASSARTSNAEGGLLALHSGNGLTSDGHRPGTRSES